MPVVLTFRQEIQAKTGKKYVIYRGLKNDGDTCELFLDEEQDERFGLSIESVDSNFLETAKRVANASPLKVFYNERGRIHDIEVE